jgi:hypothetical protein
MRDDSLYLSNIKECIERIESYTRDGKEAFMQNPMIQDAVIRIAFPNHMRYIRANSSLAGRGLGVGFLYLREPL